MMRFCSVLIMCIVLGITGCVSSNRHVVNNVFISEATPEAEVVVPDSFKFIGSVKNISSDGQWTWNKESFMFIEDVNGDKVVDRGIDLLVNKINTGFVTDYFGSFKSYVNKGQVDINGKMCPTITQAVLPSSAGFMTRFILDQGLGSADLILVTIVALRVRNDVMFEVGYHEDISHMGYKLKEWNNSTLDEKQVSFLREFHSRAHAAVNLSKVKHN